MSIAEEAPATILEPAAVTESDSTARRLTTKEMVNKANELKATTKALVDGVLGPDKDGEPAEGLVGAEDGEYHVTRGNDGRVETTGIKFLPHDHTVPTVTFNMHQGRWESAPAFSIATQSGEIVQETSFNPNHTPHPEPGVDGAAFDSVGKFLAIVESQSAQNQAATRI